MPTSSLASVFDSTREDLRAAGLERDAFVDLVAARLLIERVGDSENLAWWDSLVLGEVGRDRLQEVAEKTHLRARIDLAQKIGRKVESERLPDDAVSLFSFGPRYESRLEAALDEIDSGANITFAELEHLSVSKAELEEEWTAPIVEALGGSNDETSLPSPDPEGVLQMEDGRELTEAAVEDSARDLLTTFLRGYGTGMNTPHVPYYALTAGLETIND